MMIMLQILASRQSKSNYVKFDSLGEEGRGGLRTKINIAFFQLQKLASISTTISFACVIYPNIGLI